MEKKSYKLQIMVFQSQL